MPVDRLRHPCLGDSRKIAQLSDLEYRVWDQYQLSADDFGVLPLSAAKLQGDNRSLRTRSLDVIHAALVRLVDLELVTLFIHQDEQYICQNSWQRFQKIQRPRSSTHWPCPPSEVLQQLEDSTVELFKNFHKGFPAGFKKTLSRAHARKRLTANGKRLTANGKVQNGEEVQEKGGKPHPIRDLLTHHRTLFIAKVGEEPAAYSGKDAKQLQRLLSTQTPEKVRGVMTDFFESTDAFIEQSGYTIGAFVGCFNKLLVHSHGPPTGSISEKSRRNLANMRQALAAKS